MGEIKDWIPFFQTLIWPLLIVLLIFILRDFVTELFQIAKNRIKEGAEVTIGPEGISLGRAPKLNDITDNDEVAIKEISASDSKEFLYTQFYLVHGAEFTNSPSEGDYLIRVQIESDDSKNLKKIEKIAYHLHHTYYNRVRERKNPKNNFELQFNAYGQFLLRAEVFFKGSKESLTLWRYLNF